MAVSLQDIAAKAGCSVSTVSRAMRGSPRVPAAERERLQAIAAEMGYRPNPMVSALMQYRRTGIKPRYLGNLAYFDTVTTRKEIDLYPSFCANWLGAQERADSAGYGLERFWLGEPEHSPERWRTILEARGIRGVLIAVVAHGKNLSMDVPIDLSPFAVASIGARLRNPEFHSAQNDQFRTAWLACEKLHELGCRRIAFISTPNNDITVDHRFLSGFIGFQSTLRLRPALKPHFYDPDDLPALERWLQLEKPDAVLLNDVEHAGLVHQWNTSSNAKMLVVELDWYGHNPRSYGVDQRAREIGSAAVDLVIAQINRGEFGPPDTTRTVMIEGHWVEPSVPQTISTTTSTSSARQGGRRRVQRHS